MYAIFRHSWTGDEDICADIDGEFDYFDNKYDAEYVANDLTKEMSKDEWIGYKWHGCRFYVEEVSDVYLKEVQHRNAMILASRM